MTVATRPTPIEASFLELERAGLPMHVAGVVLLEGGRPVTLARLKHLLQERVRRLPKFRERAQELFGGRGTQWISIKAIDYEAHMFHHTLPSPGRRSQLNQLCANIHERPLDRRRPLWELHLVDGLSGDRQALVIKTHHAITDGLAGVEIAEVLFDPAPGARRPGVPAMRFVETRSPTPMTALQALVGLAFAAASAPIVFNGPFNGPVSARRTFGMATIPMDDIRRLKHRVGGSVDDVVVATVAAGISAYLHEIGYPEIPPTLKAMLPVSTRPLAPGEHFGNHVSAVFLDLPMNAADLAAAVRRVAASKTMLRTAHAAIGSALLVDRAGLLPYPIHRAVLRLVSELPFASLVLSDVPGPDDSLYLLGRRVVACYPMMPLAPRVGLAIAAISMGGSMSFGVTADPGLVVNPQRLATAIARAVPRPSGLAAAPERRRAGFRPNITRITSHRRTATS